MATTLATAPSVLILDEPTFGQDRRTAGELLDLLAALRARVVPSPFVTHDRDFATALADRTLRLAPPHADQRRASSEALARFDRIRTPCWRAPMMAKLAAALLLLTVLFVSVDPLTPAVILTGLAGSVWLSGLAWRSLLARTWPILLAALSVAVVNSLFAAPAGDELIRIGPIGLSPESLASGIALGLRVLAIAYTGVLAVATTDPTDLTDSLIQQLHLSPRFAVGALAAVRLLPVMAGEWQTISLARRRYAGGGRTLAAGRPAAVLREAADAAGQRYPARGPACRRHGGARLRQLPCRSVARRNAWRPGTGG